MCSEEMLVGWSSCGHSRRGGVKGDGSNEGLGQEGVDFGAKFGE